MLFLPNAKYLQIELRPCAKLRLTDGAWNSEAPIVENGQRIHQLANDSALLQLSDGFGWNNPLNELDVNRDGMLSASDILQIVNFLNGSSPKTVNSNLAAHAAEENIGTTRDNSVTPLDLPLVIDAINAKASSARLQ